MSSPERKPLNPLKLALDLVLVAGFFTFFYYKLQVHVPSSDPFMIRFWSTLAAACMSGVFWLALQMLTTVFRFQRDSRK